MTQTAEDDERPDIKVINELLTAFHEKLGEQWNPEAEADQFIADMRVTHPEAFDAWVEAHIVDIVVRFLRDLERRQRDRARHIRKNEMVRRRAREFIRAERRREAEARGEVWDETEDIDTDAEKVQSIFEMVVNTTEDGVTKRIGSWTLNDMRYIARQYHKVGAGFIRQGQTVETLADIFEFKRRELLRQAKAAGNTTEVNHLSDPTLTVAEVLTEEEVTQVWIGEADSEAQATNP